MKRKVESGLYRVTVDLDGRGSTMEQLVLGALDAGGRIMRNVAFDPDDDASALAALDELWLDPSAQPSPKTSYCRIVESWASGS